MAWKCFHQNKLTQLSIVRGPLVITFCFYSFENQNIFSWNSGKHPPSFLLVLLYDSFQPFIHSFLNLVFKPLLVKNRIVSPTSALSLLFKIPLVNICALTHTQGVNCDGFSFWCCSCLSTQSISNSLLNTDLWGFLLPSFTL